jgi:hypothetical protein
LPNKSALQQENKNRNKYIMSFKKFKENLGGGGSYLKAKEFEDGREVMIMPWLYNGELVDYIAHYEAWVWDDENGGKRADKKKSVRITQEEFDAGIDYEKYNFSESTFKGKTTQDGFRGCIAFLFKDIETHSLKVASFTQVTLCTSLIKFLDEDSKFFTKNLRNKIIVIGKENEQRWSASLKDDDENIGDTFEGAIESFSFSWENYMDGLDPFVSETTGSEILAMLMTGSGKPKTQAKKQAAKPSKKTTNQEEEWTQVETPKGAKLGDLSLDELKTLEIALDKQIKAGKITMKHKLVIACIRGIEHHEAMKSEDMPNFEDEDDLPL